VCINCVSSRSKDALSVVVFCYMLMCVGCFGLVVSTCQVIGWKDTSEDTLTWWGDYLHKAQVKESVCVYFSFVWFVYVPMCSPRPYTIYTFHTPMTWYSLFVLKVSLNTNKTNKTNLENTHKTPFSAYVDVANYVVTYSVLMFLSCVNCTLGLLFLLSHVKRHNFDIPSVYTVQGRQKFRWDDKVCSSRDMKLFINKLRNFRN